MKRARSIPQYFLGAIGHQSLIWLFFLFSISFFAAFSLTRNEAANNLEASAMASAEAFHDRILEGDIRSVESQLRKLFQIRENESVHILNADHSSVYRSFTQEEKVKDCKAVGKACFDGLFNKIQVFTPISVSDASSKESALYFLFVSKKIALNWNYFYTLFSLFIAVSAALAYGFMRFSKKTSLKLSEEIVTWAERLKNDPKNSVPFEETPLTELDPLKEALGGLNAQIEKFEKVAGDKVRLSLLRGIAHDLLSPMSRFQLYFDILCRGIDKTGHEETLTELRDAVGSVIEIASQVKAIDEDEVLTEKIELVQTITQEVRRLNSSKAIIEKEISLNLKTHLTKLDAPFSKTEVSRIVSNLVENAAHASDHGSVVTVELGKNNKGSYFSVADRGCGIPENVKGKIFHSVFTSKVGTGTGLGLTTVKFICDRRDAKVSFESEANLGTKFTVYLPEEREKNYV